MPAIAFPPWRIAASSSQAARVGWAALSRRPSSRRAGGSSSRPRGAEQVDGAEVLPGVDLTDEAVRRGRGAGGRRPAGRAAAGRGQPGRRVLRRRQSARTAARRLRAAVHGEPAPDVPGHPGRAAAPDRRPAAARSCASPSRAAVHPFPGASGYVASKAAVIAFAQAGRRRVPRRRSALQRRATERHRHARPTGQPSPARTSAAGCDPAQIASTIRFLAGDESAATSGAAIPVYGRA